MRNTLKTAENHSIIIIYIIKVVYTSIIREYDHHLSLAKLTFSDGISNEVLHEAGAGDLVAVHDVVWEVVVREREPLEGHVAPKDLLLSQKELDVLVSVPNQAETPPPGHFVRVLQQNEVGATPILIFQLRVQTKGPRIWEFLRWSSLSLDLRNASRRDHEDMGQV